MYCSRHGAMAVADCDECNEDPVATKEREEMERELEERDLSHQSATSDQPAVPPAPLVEGEPEPEGQ